MPHSTLVNFAALVALIGAVLTLQVIGHRLESMRVPAAVTPAVQPTLEASSAPPVSVQPTQVALPATVPAALPAQAPVQAPAPQVVDAPQAPVPSIAAAVSPQAAPQPTAPAAPAPQQAAPAIVTLTPTPDAPAVQQPMDPRPEWSQRSRATRTSSRFSGRASRAADRAVSVDELDNESARQAYLAALRGATQPAPRAAAHPAALPPPMPQAAAYPAAPGRGSSLEDLDGESARQQYLSENRGSSSSSAGKSSKSPRASGQGN